MEHIRNAVVNSNIIPVLCGAAFRNKGVQVGFWIQLCISPVPLDIKELRDQPSYTDKQEKRKSDEMNFLQRWHSK